MINYDQFVKALYKTSFIRPTHEGLSQDSRSNIEKLPDLYTDAISQLTNAAPIESVNYRNSTHDILQVDIDNKSFDRRLLIVAGTHGNEQAGIFAVKELLTEGAFRGLTVRIILNHNPIGNAYFSRYNKDGYDLNRDFKKVKQPETAAVIKSFEEFSPDFCISLHEGPQEGMFFYFNKFVSQVLADKLTSRLDKEGIELAQKSYFGNMLKKPGQFKLKGFIMLGQKIWSVLFGFRSLGYYTTKKGIAFITVETSWSAKREQRVIAHKVLIKELQKLLLNQ